MSDPITRAVKAISSLNKSISNPKQFPKVMFAVLVSSGLFGYGLMQIVDRKREANMGKYFPQEELKNSRINGSTSMTHNEALVRAMVENAKNLSPKENLENAAMAQKNFMLVPFDESVARGAKDVKFLRNIAKRGEEIRNRSERDASSELDEVKFHD